MDSVKPTVYLAADHAGFTHKNEVRDWLQSEGYTVVDYGAHEYVETDDFPDFISQAARAVSTDPTQRALLFGGSGQGEAMLANAFPQVRAAVYYGGPQEIVTLSRAHNDANILSLGARFLSVDDAKAAIWEWLRHDIAREEKYARRIEKAEAYKCFNN